MLARRHSFVFYSALLVLPVLLSACPGRGAKILRNCPFMGSQSMPWPGLPLDAMACAADVEFGELAVGVPASRVVALYHGGQVDPITVTDVAIAGTSGSAGAFSLTLYLDSGAGVTPAVLPVVLGAPDESTGLPPEVLYVEVTFDGAANPFPNDQLRVTSDDETTPNLMIDITGSLSDCMAGFLDCDGDPGNGCEVDVADPITCGTNCMDLVDCEAMASVDSDMGSMDWETPGTVTDFVGCAAGACMSDVYEDSCAGTVLTEYAASGDSYSMDTFDCVTLETYRCEPGTELSYRTPWGCSGAPGACAPEAEILDADCATTTGCVGTCGSSMNGCAFSSGICLPATGLCFDSMNADIDLDMTGVECMGCGQAWNIGGEVSSPCCGDDPNEHDVLCNANSANGTCGAGTPNACCDAGSDCVDESGQCRTAGDCYTFGSGMALSFCAGGPTGGVWEDPDAAPMNCTAAGCGFAWVPGGTGMFSACCGDDMGEDFEGSSDCCYNGEVLAHGTASTVQPGMACYNGELYECGSMIIDDGDLATPNGALNDLLGDWSAGLVCSGMDSWCNVGWADCSASTPGCDNQLNDNPSCSNATDLGGPYPAGTISNFPTCDVTNACNLLLTQGDDGERWFSFVAEETDLCTFQTEIEIFLSVPAGVDYELRLYTGCGSMVDSSNVGGFDADEYVSHSSGAAGPQTYYVEVRWLGGASCTDWNLTIYGGNCF